MRAKPSILKSGQDRLALQAFLRQGESVDGLNNRQIRPTDSQTGKSKQTHHEKESQSNTISSCRSAAKIKTF